MGKIGEAVIRVARRSTLYEKYTTPTESTSGFGDNFQLLFRWKGSIYRLVWKEFLVYMALYVSISVVHDFLIIDSNSEKGFEVDRNATTYNSSIPIHFLIQKYNNNSTLNAVFEDVAAYCTKFVSSLQIVLLIGFFTSTAMNRWFALVNNVPGTTKVTTFFVHSLKENQPQGVQIVQQYARWILLSWTLVFRLVCPSLKEAYPDLMSLQNEGLILEHERLQLEREPPKSHPRLVINWNISLLRFCARREMFYNIADYTRNLDCLMVFKKSCNSTIKFAYKNIPSALIQVVSVAIYVYGLASLMARPPSYGENGTLNTTIMSIIIGYIPIVNVIQFFLFYSWLKFGRIASNAFGEDKDDINVKHLLYCHIEDAFQAQALYVKSSIIEKVAMASVKNPSQIWIDHTSTAGYAKKHETLHNVLHQ